MKISDGALDRARAARHRPASQQIDPRVVFKAAEPMPGVLPKGETGMANDSAISGMYSYAAANMGPYSTLGGGLGLGFFGYQYLAQLALIPEIRNINDTLAREMTRKWIKITAAGDDDKTDTIDAVNGEFDRLNVQHFFRRETELDGDYGICHIYPDFEASDAENEVELFVTPEKIGIGALKRLAIIDPTWTYPRDYNASDALAPHFFQPQKWAVQGKLVHASRLLTFIPREVPDILKPAYAFGGLSMTQMVLHYVRNFRQTQSDVARLVNNFSQRGIKTNLSSMLSGGAGVEMDKRAELLSLYGDNFGVLLLGEKEEYFNIATPLAGLDKLQAQAQEQQCSISHLPLVILTGITPSGLNASSADEIRVFYDYVHSCQEQRYRRPLKKLLDIVQLSLFGKIDPTIDFKFEPLWQLDEAGLAGVQKTKADTGAVLVAGGIIATDEERTRIQNDEFSDYQGLKGPPPPPPADPSLEDDPSLTGEQTVTTAGEKGKANGEESGV